MPEYLTKTANKICDVIVQVGPCTSWVRSSALQITWKESLASIKFTWNLPAGPVLAWGTSPTSTAPRELPVPPVPVPPVPPVPLSIPVAIPAGNRACQRSRAVLCPWFNYNQLLPLLCPVLDSLHIVLEKLSGIAAFVYIKYRMIEDLATALFSFLSHAFLPKHFPLLLPDQCLNCV